MNQLGEGTNTIGAISDYFVVETKILSTRTADLYISQDKTRGGDVSLWQLRAPLEVGSSMIAEYIKRMEIIEAINPPVSDFVGFAVDNKGTAFAVLARLDGNTLTEGTPEFSELERRFVSCVELISRIHNASIICGDICKNSFWLNRAGSVRFIGVMGAYELDRENGIKLYPESQYYLAPEQISDCNIDLSVDVYALGVLGYFLFTGKFPEKTPIQPSQVLKGVPFWADEVLLKALSENPAQRYQSAVELLADIKGKRELYAQDPNKVRHQIRNSGVEDSPSTGISSISLGTQLPIKKVKFSKGTILKISLVVMLISVALVGLWPFYSQFSHAKKLSSSLSAHRAIAGEQLNTAIDGLLSGNLASPGKKKFLNQIVNSDDPVAHAVLVTLSRNSAYPEIRKECENAIVERARSAGISRSADIASVWLSSFSGNINPPAYVEEVLLVLNGTLPSDARAKAIRRIYAENPPLALNLAASFSLDSSNVEDYRSVLAQLLGDKLKINDLESKSSLSLILASSSLSENFGSEVIDRRNKIPDADILWLIKILAERDDANVRYLAETANARKLLTPKRAFFLSIIENRQDLPTPVLRSLVKASLGIIKAEDISSFGRWYDNSIEEILLTLCSTETDPDVLYEVFDTVASKTLLDQLGGSLIEWVKKNYWDTRLEFIRSIGILALGEHSSKTEIQDALSIFDRYVADKELLGALMSADSTKVATSVIDRFREVIPVSNLLILLNDRDREVRLTAISALARSNDVGALRVILDGYEKENDQIVKKAYEEKFWVVKQRLVGKK